MFYVTAEQNLTTTTTTTATTTQNVSFHVSTNSQSFHVPEKSLYSVSEERLWLEKKKKSPSINLCVYFTFSECFCKNKQLWGSVLIIQTEDT